MLLCLLANLGVAGGDGSSTVVPETQAAVGGGFHVNALYYKFEEWKRKKKFELELEEERAKLRRIEKKRERAEEKAVQENPPAGILANLKSLQKQERNVEARIYSLEAKIEGLEVVLQKLAFEKLRDDDEDDFEMMLQ